MANRSGTELRGEILAAARAEFAQYGLTGARIERIAKSASASKERLYAHFGDKESLFRLVALTDAGQFFSALTLRPDAVPEFVGDLFDVLRAHPDHLRMMTWARLEGLSFDEPQTIGHDVPARELAAIEAAQAAGHVDAQWKPLDLLVMLFGIGTAWANWPHEDAVDEADVAAHRAAAVEAAARIIAPRPPAS